MSRTYDFEDRAIFDNAEFSPPIPGVDVGDFVLNSDTIRCFTLVSAAGLLRVDGTQIIKAGDFRNHLYATVSSVCHELPLGTDRVWTTPGTYIAAWKVPDRQAAGPYFLHAPVASGTRAVGKVLTVSQGRAVGTPHPISFWQWERDGVAIPGAYFPWYVPVDADIGAIIQVRQTWINAYGLHSSVSTGGSAIVASPITALTGNIRYVAPVLSGTGDGSSKANAAAFSMLNREISRAGPGGNVLLATDRGNYVIDPPAGQPHQINIGGSEGSPVKIRGVDFTTDRDGTPWFVGTRDQPLDQGQFLNLPATENRGEMFLNLRSPNSLVTSSTAPATDQFFDPSFRLAGVPSGAPITFTPTALGATPGVMPAPLVAGMVYYLIRDDEQLFRAATTKANATAGTPIAIDITSAHTGNLTVRTVGEEGTCTFNTSDMTVTLPTHVYDSLVDGRTLKFTNTGGALPVITGGLVAHTGGVGAVPIAMPTGQYFYFVKKIGSNKVRLHDTAKKVEKTDEHITFASAGTGTHLAFCTNSTVGPNFIEWTGIGLRDIGGLDGAINFASWSRGIKFKEMQAENIYRFFTNTSTAGASAATTGDASLIDFEASNGYVYGCERGYFRFRYGSRGLLFNDLWVDGRRFYNDPFPSLFVSQSQGMSVRTVGSTVLTTVSGPGDLEYNRCGATRAYQNAGAGNYWNADGFETSSEYCWETHYIDCESSWHTDGGFDDKSDGLSYTRCLAEFCKRGYRLWNSATLTDCVGAEMQQGGVFFGENGGRCMFGIFKNPMTVDVIRGYFVDSTGVPMFNNEINTGRAIAQISFTDTIFRFNPEGRFSLPGVGTGVTFNTTPTIDATIDAVDSYSGGTVIAPATAVDEIVATIEGVTPSIGTHAFILNPNNDVYIDADMNIRVGQTISYGAAISKQQVIRVAINQNYEDILFNYYPEGSVTDVDAEAFFTSAEDSLDDTLMVGVTQDYRDALTTLILELKAIPAGSSNAWDRAAFLPVNYAPNTNLGLRDLKNVHHASIIGGVTKTPTTLWQSDGTTGYLQWTSFVPNAAGQVKVLRDDATEISECTTDVITVNPLTSMGTISGITTRYNTTQAHFRVNQTNAQLGTTNNTNGTGMWVATRLLASGAGAGNLKRNGISRGTTVTASAALTATPPRLFTNATTNLFAAHGGARWYMGLSLTDAEAAAVTSAIASFKQTCQAIL